MPPRLRRPRSSAVVSLISIVAVAACQRASSPAASVVAADLRVVGQTPAEGAVIRLDQPLAVAFSEDVDLATVNAASVRFVRIDADGNPHAEQPRGVFSAHDSSAHAAGGGQRILEFRPALPVAASADDGLVFLGLQPASTYSLTIPGRGDRPGERGASWLLSTQGQALPSGFTMHFATVAGATLGELFRDPKPGGPRVVAVTATPSGDGVDSTVAMGAFDAPTEVRVRFDQALNPAAANLPRWRARDLVRVDRRSVVPKRKGRVFLEYDDPEFGPATWIPASVQVEANDQDGCTLLLTPVGVLPNHASVRVVVEPTLEDIVGESNVSLAGYDRVVARLQTEAGRAPRFDALVADFADPDLVDFDAAFLEPMADVGGGGVRPASMFPGEETGRDYAPRSLEVLLNTDFTQVTPVSGPPVDVAGGVFEFRNVTIPAGVTVRAIGTKPMVWRVTGDFVVDGDLTVSGGDGQRVSDDYNRGLTGGGVAGCAGGRGGHGSPSLDDSDREGEAGFGPFATAGGGGAGGAHSCTVNGCSRGGGGGGGSFATAGDPHHVLAWFGRTPRLPLVGLGRGGPMCGGSPPTGPQAAAGPLAFVDGRPDDDFWGTAVDLRRGLRIAGELLGPRGGGGGGGGGDTGPRCPPNLIYYADARGGGGGGGGGALIVQALGRIVIRAGGRIRADGGNGGGGSQVGTNSNAGGGGGGSGGMVILMSASGIHIVAHGAPYAEAESGAEGAYTFAVSADGGVGLRTPFYGNAILGKYPATSGAISAAGWDANPVGGFGGMGLVQLMVPAGDNASVAAGGDGTDTRLDDRVFFYEDDAHLARGLAADVDGRAQAHALSGAAKMRYLGWRGLRDAGGVGRDDRGDEVVLPHSGHGEGDIRPSPILLPVPYGPVSRLRTRWIDTGATARRSDPSGEDLGPRTMVPQRDPSHPDDPLANFLPGPIYAFAGTFAAANTPTGFVRYRQTARGPEREVVEVLAAAVPVDATVTTTWRDRGALRVDLRQPLPGPADRYVGYAGVLQAALGEPLVSLRILAHDDTRVYLALDREAILDRAVARLQIEADFVGLDADAFTLWHREGERRVPDFDLRIGFAFHVDPARPDWVGGEDHNRLPRDPSAFLLGLDLGRPDLLGEVRGLGKAAGRTEGATAVQCDLLFDTAFRETPPHVGLGIAGGPRPTLRWLVLPAQF